MRGSPSLERGNMNYICIPHQVDIYLWAIRAKRRPTTVYTTHPCRPLSWDKTMRTLDNSKRGSTQQWWHWHVARIISSQKIYGLYGLKHHIVEMRGGVTDAGQPTTNIEDKDTQPMEAGGWVSQLRNVGSLPVVEGDVDRLLGKSVVRKAWVGGETVWS